MKAEETGVGRWIRPRRPADRRLVDIDHFIQRVDALEFFTAIDFRLFLIEQLGERMEQHFKHQRALAGPGDAGDTGKQARAEF